MAIHRRVPPAIPRLPSRITPLKTRKDEIEAKQKQIAKMLAESQTDAVLLFDPPNLAWLTGAAICQGIPDPNDWPAVYLTAEQRVAAFRQCRHTTDL